MKLSDYVKQVQAQGRCTFTLDQAQAELNISRHAVIAAIEHLSAKKEIVSIAKGFYLIVTPEYRIYGCLPADYFIPYLMQYWQQPYYAGLLTAAMYHGASHQQPQVFQVVTNKKKALLECGKIKVRFIVKKDLRTIPTETVNTIKSVLTISSSEATVMDLLRYPQWGGGINHIVTLLTELQEKITEDKLNELLETQPQLAWKQRLGYLLEYLDNQSLANCVKQYLDKQGRVDYVLLAPELGKKSDNISSKDWKLMINTTIESDI
jgi:predicted transcriptional regulator of viral defense system